MTENNKNEEQMTRLPVLALRSMSVLPSMIVHFDVSRPKSAAAVEKALEGDGQIFLIAQRDPEVQDVKEDDLWRWGTICVVKNMARLPHGLLRVMAEGIKRAQLVTLEEGDCLFAGVRVPEEPMDLSANEQTGMIRGLKDIFGVYARGNNHVSPELLKQLLEIEDLDYLIGQISINLHLDYVQRQRLLEAEGRMERYEALCRLLADEIEIGRIRSELQQKVKAQIDKGQKEYFLREQLKVIREELGEEAPFNEADQYRERLQKLEASQEVKGKLEREIARFKSLGGNTAEASVSRTYIETLLDMPWEKSGTDSMDLKRAARILDEDHYGLEKVKERVLEFLAVRQLTKRGASPILCLAGPPGTGKTSIARSVARALDKKYVRISLGGVRDEAEIRGHRRTYIGAMPGRIAAGIRTAGVKNPLILLDEIDKLSSSYSGDPSSALLEVLDSEQNVRFSDHYLDVPLDLSEVLFIATANDLHTVPMPLLDRMEVIEVSSYTENEKLHIAKEHLLPKQRERHGLEPKALTISSKAMQAIISGYTREAGVRQLERRIGEICRKAARRILEDNRSCVRVKDGTVEDFLGIRKYNIQLRNEKDEVGIVRGLAWTSVGGVTLQIEVNSMPGKGEFLMTGQLGDVMRESARIAITYVRSIADRYGIEEAFFREHDLHIHIPEGAVPKDGPSAGIAMATAILSAAASRPVRCDAAMTGEVTLRGRVLPIGGLKEKLLAAKNARMRTVIVPEANRRDVEELSQEITGTLQIVYAQEMQQVLDTALAG